ncbi:MAG: phosphoribosylformylglycinamidine synthase subunit PurQ [Deltaproteobacteria bacterium]|nr:phosphoribosylformylglycinamidine synthase subunit PurQ [Deltaproteobacteria bacterium]
MKVAVLVYPGSNCDHDCYHVAKHVFGSETSYVWHKDGPLSGYDCVIVPGGFSYGDHLRPGAIASYSPITEELRSFAGGGGFVIGICNGFQILCEAGLLPGSLMRNKDLKFICEKSTLKVKSTNTPFSSEYKEGEVITIPIAHADGNYFADDDTLKSLQDNDQIVFTYADSNGKELPEANPNGSLLNIAGIVNEKRNVLGMMPHPERAAEEELGGTDGRGVFESIIKTIG